MTTQPTEGAMRAAKHTDGPWRVGKIEPGLDHGGFAVLAANGFRIAWVNPFASTHNDGVAEANAELIANAPQLQIKLTEFAQRVKALEDALRSVCFLAVAPGEPAGKNIDIYNTALAALSLNAPSLLPSKTASASKTSPTSAQVGTEEITDTRRLDWLEDGDRCYWIEVQSQPAGDVIWKGQHRGLRAAIDYAMEGEKGAK